MHLRKGIIIVIGVAAIVAIIGSCARLSQDAGRYQHMVKRSIKELRDDGMLHLRNGELDSALVNFTSIKLQLENELPQEQEHEAAMALCEGASAIASKYGDYPQAFQYILPAEEAARKHNYDDVLLWANYMYSNISDIYHDGPAAISNARKAFQISLNGNDTERTLEILSNMAVLSMTYNAYDSIAGDVERIRNTRLPLSSHLQYVNNLVEAARSYSQKDLAGTISGLDNALAFSDSTWRSGRSKYIMNVLKSNIYYEMGHYEDVLLALREAYGDLDLDRHPDVAIDTYSKIATSFQALGEKDSANYYAMKYMQMADSVLMPNKYGNMRDLKASVTLRQAAEDYRVLTLKNNSIMWLLWIAFGVLTLVCIFLYVIYRQKRLLAEHNRELYLRYLESQERERQEAIQRKHYADLLEESRRNATESRDEPDRTAPSYSTSNLTDDIKVKIADDVNDVLLTSERIFEQDFNITILSELIGQPKRYVSQAINEVFRKNFPTLLGEARVREACERLTDEGQYGHLTIEGIGSDLGFKSRTNFVQVFKKVTGLTPTQYQKTALGKVSK